MATQTATRNDLVESVRLRLSDLDIPNAISKVEWPRVDLPSVDIGKAARDAAGAVHIGRRRRQPQWPLALGGLAAGVAVGWAIFGNGALRTRLIHGANAIRDRIAEMQSSGYRAGTDPIAFDQAETAPIAPSELTGTPDPTGYPAGLGSRAHASKARPSRVASQEKTGVIPMIPLIPVPQHDANGTMT